MHILNLSTFARKFSTDTELALFGHQAFNSKRLCKSIRSERALLHCSMWTRGVTWFFAKGGRRAAGFYLLFVFLVHLQKWSNFSPLIFVRISAKIYAFIVCEVCTKDDSTRKFMGFLKNQIETWDILNIEI